MSFGSRHNACAPPRAFVCRASMLISPFRPYSFAELARVSAGRMVVPLSTAAASAVTLTRVRVNAKALIDRVNVVADACTGKGAFAMTRL